MLFIKKAIAFLFKANAFSKKKTKKTKKSFPPHPLIKEKEKEKEKDDDYDSYVRVRACA